MRLLVVLFAVSLWSCTSQPKEPTTADIKNAADLNKYLTENFGMKGYETSWYPAIQGVSVRGGDITIRTSSFAPQTHSSICMGVSGFAFSNPESYRGLDRVVILDSNGQESIVRNGLSGSCSNPSR